MKKISLIALSLLNFEQAYSQNDYSHCNQILVQGVMEKFEQTHDTDMQIALKKWACSYDSGSGSGGGGLQLNVIDVLTGGANGESASSWKRDNCSSDDSQYEGTSSNHILIQTASDSITRAWSQCVKQNKSDGLVCYGKESSGSLEMKIDYDYRLGDAKEVEIVTRGLTALTRTPGVIKAGQRTLMFTKANPNQEATFVLNAEAEHTAITCSYIIPPKPRLTRVGCEELRYSSLQGGFISQRDYDYLSDQNQVPHFKNGRLAGYYPCSFYLNPK